MSSDANDTVLFLFFFLTSLFYLMTGIYSILSNSYSYYSSNLYSISLFIIFFYILTSSPTYSSSYTYSPSSNLSIYNSSISSYSFVISTSLGWLSYTKFCSCNSIYYSSTKLSADIGYEGVDSIRTGVVDYEMDLWDELN